MSFVSRIKSLSNRQFLLRLLLIIVIILICFFTLSFFESYEEVIFDSSFDRTKIAVIYAAPTFHEEVTSSIACILNEMGFFVVVYIGNGVHLGGTLVPFSQNRKRSSQAFYGECVSKWITINGEIKRHIPSPDLLVIITFPMLTHGFKIDSVSLDLLKGVSNSPTSIVFITHRTNELLYPTVFPLVESLLPREQCTYLFLGRHTYLDAGHVLDRFSQLETSPTALSLSSSHLLTHSISEQEANRIATHSYFSPPSHTLGDPSSLHRRFIIPVIPKRLLIPSSPPPPSSSSFSSRTGRILSVSPSPSPYPYPYPSTHTSNSNQSLPLPLFLPPSSTQFRTLSSQPLQPHTGQLTSEILPVRNDEEEMSLKDWEILLASLPSLSHPPPSLTFHEKTQSFSTIYSFLRANIPSSISSLLSPPLPPESHSVRILSPPPLGPLVRWEGGPIFTIQGNFGGKHAHRKNPQATVQCLQRIEEEMISTRRVALQAIKSHKPLPTSPSSSTPEKPLPSSIPLKSLSIDLIGHLTGSLSLGSLRTGEVRLLSGLDSRAYFRAISQARFMIVSIGDQEYFTSRATSSVPAALISEVPLVTSLSFLSIYPCLESAPIHRKIAADTECEAIERAVRLTEEEYVQAKREIRNCSAVLWAQAKQTFSEIVSKQKSSRV